MKMILFLVVYAASIVLAQAADTPKKPDAPAVATHEKLSDAHSVELREIQLDIERAQSALKDAKLSVVDTEKKLNDSVQKANADIQKMLEAAGCKGCQLTEVASDPKNPNSRKILELIRPPAETAKK